MAFVNDLDLLSGAATVAALLATCFVTYLVLRDWRNGWKIEFEAPARLIGILGMLCIIGAANSYSPDQDAPRKTIEGRVSFVAKRQGRHTFTEFICAPDCQLTGGYALALDRRAARVARIGSVYDFTYLEKPTGNALAGTSLKVIRVAVPGSAEALYAIDLTNHPYRIVAYCFDLVLLLCPFALALYFTKAQDHRRISALGSAEGAGG